MPRQLNLEDELKRASAQIEADPNHRFPCVSRINANTYLHLIETCIESGKPLSNTIEAVCTDYFHLKSRAGLNLDATSQEVVKALATLWQVEPDEAIRKLIDRTGMEVLDEELTKRNRLTAIQNK